MNESETGNTRETDAEQVLSAEAEFHDEWAASTPIDKINVREAFEAPTAPENRFILKLIDRHLGGLDGQRVLDVGAGLGESSVYFALKGAKVTTSDLSPGMVERALELGRAHGVELEGVVSAGESLGVEPGAFDIVYVANTIHHVTDRDALYKQIRSAMRPGGLFVSWDPIAYNPAINIYRRMATDVRTPDERPLTFADVKHVSEHFESAGHREFWISTLALFAKYYLVDQVHPNDERYWKKILTETDRSLWWWKPLAGVDSVLTRVPLVRRLAWNMVMWGTRGAD